YMLLDSYFVLLLVTASSFLFFFFHAPATPEIYTLSLHDALPIFRRGERAGPARRRGRLAGVGSRRRRDARLVSGRRDRHRPVARDRKSTRLNSSHVAISYAVFCLKKKKK